MNNIPENEFLFNKRDFMLNALTLGAAVEILANISKRPAGDCLNYLINKAEERMSWQTPESIDKAIDDYYTGRQNKAKAVLSGFHKSKTA